MTLEEIEMRSKTKLRLSATALGVLAATAVAWGVNEGEPSASTDQRHGIWGPRGGHRHGGDRMGMMTRHLNLTDEQQTTIRGILETARADGEVLRAEVAAMRQELQTTIRENGYYEDQVRMAVESKSTVLVDLTLLGIRTMSQIYAELTPEQQAQADEMLERRGGHFGRHRFGPLGE